MGDHIVGQKSRENAKRKGERDRLMERSSRRERGCEVRSGGAAEEREVKGRRKNRRKGWTRERTKDRETISR